MKIRIETEYGDIKGGRYARASQLRLVGHGETDAEAGQQLSSAVAVWCEGLAALGGLDKALRRAKLEPLNEAAPGFHIELIAAEADL